MNTKLCKVAVNTKQELIQLPLAVKDANDMATRIWHGQWWQIGMTLAATSGVLFSWHSAIAQIAPDRTLGAESSVVTPNVDIKGLPSDRIDGGAIRGANLFHSFQEFNVREGRGAYFSNPAGIENIFSRVTGTNASNIYGKLGVLGNANLFLLNPNGIIFGPNASLDLGGSFVGSTANSLKFGGGKEFSATNPTAPPLLTVNVPLGVQFNQEQPRAIVNSGNLSVGVGQNLNLTGGTVVSTGQLSAPGGQVAVAAVPGGNVVNLNPSAQLLNIETSSSVPNVGSSASLTELLESSDERSHPGLTVNGNGQVSLVGSGLPVVDGDVVARNVTAQTGTLTANHNLTLVESLLGTTGDLNLLAGYTVWVRDSVNNPFVAQAGGNLTIQGNKGIDILALNHPQTPFVSGGNLSLVSDGIISGDAHFTSGGNFSILNLSGSGGNFVSLYDPIFRSNGDFSINIPYEGPSLKIEADGNITTRAITINNPESTSVVGEDRDSATLTGGRALILRAGRDTLSAGSLTINGDISSAGNAARLSVELQAKGDINTQNISASGGNITINSTEGNISSKNINTAVLSGKAGDISITAKKDITLTGEPLRFGSFVDFNSSGGDGGNITITSTDGNIDTTKADIYSSTPNGNSGNVELNAKGNITTSSIKSYVVTNIGIADPEKNQGTAGNITLTSSDGSINTIGSNNDPIFGGILSETPKGNGGNITFHARDNITTGIVHSFILDNDPNKQQRLTNIGDAGNIKITSDTGNIEVQSPLMSNRDGDISSSTPNGYGGAIELNAPQGQIITTNRNIIAKSDNGVAGDITLTADRDIRTGNIIASSNTDDQGFPKIQLKSFQGSVFLDGGVTLSTTNTGSDFAGDISISARDKVSIANKSTISSQGNFGRIFIGKSNYYSSFSPSKVTIDNSTLSTQNSGIIGADAQPINAGEISIDTGTFSVTNSNLTSSTSRRGNGGDITIQTSGDIKIENQSIIDSEVFSGEQGKPGAIGNGGRIDIKGGSLLLNNDSQINAFVNSQDFNLKAIERPFGDAGEISINVGKGDIQINAKPNSTQLTGIFNTLGNGAETGFTNATGNGGNIDITARSLSINGTTNSDGRANAGIAAKTFGIGDAGDINITLTGLLSIQDGGFIDNSTTRQGNAGAITVKAQSINLENDNPNRRAIQSVVQNTAKGNGDTITIDTGLLSITNGAAISASTLGDGNAGNIEIKNANSVNISGRSSTNGGSSGLFTFTQTSGEGGDITIKNSDKFKVSDGAVVDARTTNGGGIGGNIILNAKQVELINGGQLISNSSGSGGAGEITVNATDRLIVNGSDDTFKGRKDINNVVNDANGRIVTLNDPNAHVDSGLFVRSEGTGSAGDITVTSPKIRLDNRGRFIADSNASEGGSITLKQNRGVLLLEHNGIISASAGRQGGGGNAGNIKINNGFIVTAPNENSDIFTNAFNGQGGAITINAFGVINIEKLLRDELIRRLGKPDNPDPQNLSSNDITALSENSPDPKLQGVLNVNAPNLDPTHGLIQLPVDLGDSSRLIAQSCPVGGQRATSQFIVTGRGGLPPNPGSALSSETFLGNAAAIASPGENPSPSASVPLREAQGVEVGPKGEILLTARPSKLNYSTSVKKFRGCYGK